MSGECQITKGRCIQCVMEEPELDDSMPDMLWELLSQGDREQCEKFLVQVVKATKQGIVNRINKRV